jgi:hypothetical protein
VRVNQIRTLVLGFFLETHQMGLLPDDYQATDATDTASRHLMLKISVEPGRI